MFLARPEAEPAPSIGGASEGGGTFRRERVMVDPAVLETLRKYVVEHILDGAGATIDADTPLLELGILNSISTTRLVGFVREQFGVDVPPEELAGRNFKDLDSISQLVTRLKGD